MTDNPMIRPIEEADLDAVVDIMATSFTRRSRQYFHDGLERLAGRPVPDGGQRWGYLIDDGGVRGAVLSISINHDYGTQRQIYTNISTWCVNQTHRGPIAKELYDRAGGAEHWVTTNLSAAKHTLKTLDRLNFRARSTGQYVALAKRNRSRNSHMLSLTESIREGLADCHVTTLQDHVQRGCVVGCLSTPDRLMPLIFLPRRIKRVLTAGQLIYCEDMQHFLAHSGPVFPWLRRNGKMALILDASTDVAEFRGKFFVGKAAKFLRGADPVWDVDHSYSEMFYLGF